MTEPSDAGGRFSVDVGGTFSDLVLLDGPGTGIEVAKGLTTPARPEEGVLTLLGAAVAPKALGQLSVFTHGSTVALNAILERAGSTVGLLATAGFRDVLELRRGERKRMFDVTWRPDPPLVPRQLRYPIHERIRANGGIEVELVFQDVRDALELFQAENVESIAIAYINAYANPVHELESERLLREHGFIGEISLSHVVSGEHREYERTSTTVIDAYVKPKVSAYLDNLSRGLADLGFRGAAIVTTSGGGAMTFDEAKLRPFEIINSGPVAGAVGTGVLCAAMGFSTAITADVGGTSFDTCLIRDGEPQRRYEGRIADMPVQGSWVDVRSIGAGGGSIARCDAQGRLHVGPNSAGADPGPICYGHGGAAVTVTDAAAYLGMLGVGQLSGDLSLDIEAARSALERLGNIMGLDAAGTARGILRLALSRMADAMREVSLEQGEDPRGAVLVAYGGAGPMFAALLAADLEMKTVVIPRFAGNFSAWGLLEQDLRQTAARTFVHELNPAGLIQAGQILEDLFGELAGRSGVQPSTLRESFLDLRYLGQEYNLTVAVPLALGSAPAQEAEISDSFRRHYEQTFGHSLEDIVEIVAVRAAVRTVLQRPAGAPTANTATATATPPRSSLAARRAYSFSAQGWCMFDIVQREWLDRGSVVRGPALVLESTTATYLDRGDECLVDDSMALRLSIGYEGARR